MAFFSSGKNLTDFLLAYTSLMYLSHSPSKTGSPNSNVHVEKLEVYDSSFGSNMLFSIRTSVVASQPEVNSENFKKGLAPGGDVQLKFRTAVLFALDDPCSCKYICSADCLFLK